MFGGLGWRASGESTEPIFEAPACRRRSFRAQIGPGRRTEGKGSKNVVAQLAGVLECDHNMKRTYILFALLGLVLGTLLTGCDQGTTDTSKGGAPATTNAAPPAPAAK